MDSAVKEKKERNKISVFSNGMKTELFLIIVLSLLAVFFAVTSDVFFTLSNLKTLTRQASIYGVIAIGMVVVITSSGIDLSVGSVTGLSGVVAALLMVNGISIPVSIIIAIITGMFIGLINGVLVYDGKVPAFIATMGTMTVVRAVIMLLTNASMISKLPEEFKAIAQIEVLNIPFLFVVWLVVIALAWFMTSKTVFGRNVYAVGSNREAARLSGINIRKTTYGVYIFSGLACSIAGILLASRLGNGVPTAGAGYELDAIAAAVVGGASLDGGAGSIVGTVLGSMIMATLRQGGVLLGVNSFILEIVIGSLIVGAVLLDKLRR
ncbi:MAG: ABC transporter permease [Alkaliphilus sp.]|nr:ABC transporter permease [Alkaliphilus sp.]